MGFSRQEYWSSLPFPSPRDHILSDLSTMTCLSWVAPHAWLSFIELDKAVVCVIRFTRFLWLWFQYVCPLMPSLNTYHLTWVFLTLDVGYLFTAAPAKWLGPSQITVTSAVDGLWSQVQLCLCFSGSHSKGESGGSSVLSSKQVDELLRNLSS